MFHKSCASSSFSNGVGSNVGTVTSHKLVSGGVVVEKLRFTWEIKNFDVLRHSVNMINAQRFEFTAGESIGLPTKWSVFLKQTEDNWIGCSFKVLKCAVNEVNVSFIFKINYPNGEEYFHGTPDPTRNSIDHDMGQDHDWGCSKVINQLSVLPLQSNGSLIIEVEFKLYNCQKSISEKTVQEKLVIYQQKFLEQLSLDLYHSRDLYVPGMNSHTTLVSKDGFEFTVNRGILAARSPGFRKIFQNPDPMLKTKEMSLLIYDLSSKTINVLLEYLLAAKLHKDWKDENVLVELLHAAHNFQLQLLAEFLNVVLVNVCTMGNAKLLAILAKQLKWEKAEMDLFNFIKQNSTDVKDLTIVFRGAGN